jgi:hypothetical protein
MKKLRLLLPQVLQKETRENFRRIQEFFEELQQMGVLESGGTGPQGPIGPQGPAGPPSTQASQLIVQRTAYEDILKGDCIVAHTTLGQVKLGTNDTTTSDASVLGVAMDDYLTGALVDVLLLGVISDAIFAVFPVNTHLFLDTSGGITDIKPTTGYLTYIGKSLGGGEILVNPSAPLQLT